ncbi:hypothetical protein ACHHYP_14418 [Achlya hypogyna]|uniref:Uncharacterized protein n=1 Tax=Achlya hypogyna TaxID=1202772 RepID=A0A1V9YD54_ACHHY|nr:hypothetical protein ACHHYP_14418 [Achlya hypogyna]
MYDAVAVSPSKKQSLLGAADVSLVVVSGKGLVALGSDGLTSNCVCETALVLRQGKARPGPKTKVAKMTRNPIWNCDVDFGSVSIGDIEGVSLAVKHVSGFTHKEMGTVLIPSDFFVGAAGDEQWFDLLPTPAMMRQTSFRQDRPYGQVCVTRATKPLRTRSESTMPTPPTTYAAPLTRPASAVTISPLHDPIAELVAVRNCHQSLPQPGETWFVVDAHWVEAWLTFVASKKTPPGPISNGALLDTSGTQVRANLELKSDARLIDPASWRLYHGWYGGGPVVTVSVPTDCRHVGRWMTKLHLPSVARVQTPAP